MSNLPYPTQPGYPPDPNAQPPYGQPPPYAPSAPPAPGQYPPAPYPPGQNQGPYPQGNYEILKPTYNAMLSWCNFDIVCQSFYRERDLYKGVSMVQF